MKAWKSKWGDRDAPKYAVVYYEYVRGYHNTHVIACDTIEQAKDVARTTIRKFIGHPEGESVSLLELDVREVLGFSTRGYTSYQNLVYGDTLWTKAIYDKHYQRIAQWNYTEPSLGMLA